MGMDRRSIGAFSIHYCGGVILRGVTHLAAQLCVAVVQILDADDIPF